MTSSEAVERAIAKLDPAPPSDQRVSVRTKLLVSINTALRVLAEVMAMRDPENIERQLLETTVTIDLADGVANLATFVSTNPTYLTKTIDRGKIWHVDSATYPLQEVADELQLSFTWPNQFIYFCISGDKIKTRNTDGSLTSLTGNLTITLLAVPAIATLPRQLEPLLIDAMVAEISSGQQQTKETTKKTR